MTPSPSFAGDDRLLLGSDRPAIAADTPFQQTVRLLRRQSRRILAASFVGAALAGAGGILVQPRYAAKAEIVIQPQPSVAGQEAIAAPPEQDEPIVQTHLAAIMSREHLQEVLDSLTRDPPTTAAGNSAAAVDSFAEARRRLRGWAGQAAAAVTRPLLSLLGHSTRASAPGDAAPARDLRLEAFERHLLVFQERGSHVIGISFTSPNPYTAAAAANRVAQRYVDTLYRQKQEAIDRALAWINRRIPELRQEAAHTEDEVQDYRVDHGLSEGAGTTDVIDQTLGDLSRQLTAAESDLTGRQTMLLSVAELRSARTGIDTLAQLLDSASLRELRNRELALLQSQGELDAQLGSMHPKALALAAELDAVRAKIRHEVDRAADDLRAQAKLAELRVASLRQRVAVAQQASRALHGTDMRLGDLEHAAATARQVYESLLQRREQLTERQEMIAPDVRVLSLATPPRRPSSPNPLLFTIPAFVACLIGGGLAAVAGDRLDQGLRSARDVNEALGVHCVGLVPQLRRQRRLRPHQHLRARPSCPYAEAIRSVAAALQLAAPHETSDVILVNSSVPNEGKTTLAVSLAVCVAMLGRRAILVDLDFRRPAILRELGRTTVSSRSGESGRAIGGIESLTDPGIDILPVRGYADNPLLPFASGDLPALLNRLRARYDCIIIDSPPLLSVTEARLLATLADRILFVVQWGRTRRDVAQNAIAMLRDTCLPGKRGASDLISAVITKVDLTRHARYRYGDTGESFVRYSRYYVQQRERGRSQLLWPTGTPPHPEDHA